MSRTNVFSVVFAVVVALGAFLYLYQHRAPLIVYVNTAIHGRCSSPIPYKIGDIDSRFGLTQSEVEKNLEEATALWSNVYGKPLFVYAPEDTNAMPIELVYDRRQQAVSVGNAIDTLESAQQDERDAVEVARTAYESAGQSYVSLVEKLNSDSKAYAEEVKRVNDAGGASPSKYKELEAERQELLSRQQKLEVMKKVLDAQGTELKKMIATYNAKVSDVNKIVQDYNATVGGEFEEGQYIQDSEGRRIYVYAYKTEDELLHTLAHEFGHALGLEHNENPASIMFAYNKSSVTLSPEDVVALRAACE